MPANAFKTLFLLLILLATRTQCLLNEKKVSRYTPSSLGVRTMESVVMWCDAALSRTVRKIFSCLFGSLLEGNTCSGRPPLLVCICPS